MVDIFILHTKKKKLIIICFSFQKTDWKLIISSLEYLFIIRIIKKGKCLKYSIVHTFSIDIFQLKILEEFGRALPYFPSVTLDF